MDTNSISGLTHETIVQRGFTFVALARPRLDALHGADATVTGEWLDQVQKDLEAAQALPTFHQRQTDVHQILVDRNGALKAAAPLLMDTFFYAKKAYPTTAHPDEYFIHSLYTHAGSSATRQNAALQAAAAAFATRREAMQAGGMPKTKIDDLLKYALAAQGKGTGHAAAEGESTVETDTTDGIFAARWAQCRTLHEAAEVAFRLDEPQRRLFILYPGGPEDRTLTIAPADPATGLPGFQVVRLDSQLSAMRRLSFTVVADGGPVFLSLQATAAVPAPGNGQAQLTTEPNHPARFAAEALGWASPDDHYLVVLNPGSAKARVEVRVLPVGSE